MKIDMSPQAVTNRMKMLDQLWELSVALKSSRIESARLAKSKNARERNKHDLKITDSAAS